MSRPDRETMLALMAAAGKPVTHTETGIVTRLDGTPVGLTTIESEGTLHFSPELYGWTEEELNNTTEEGNHQ
ncbi:hypothetical protein SAMN06298212_10568 [Ruaniaceae bacterium KH17]|nr:hypothetical protein SAMN06298212_10568 [Ruaniaceae bacterium KH17]